MALTLNKVAYTKLIEGNIEWLLGQPESPERKRIEAVLRDAPDRQYEEDYADTPFPEITEDDLEWLLKQPRTLEGRHTADVLREALGRRSGLGLL